MIIIPLNNNLALQCLGICALVEIIRIILVFFLSRPSSEIQQCQDQKIEAAEELAEIKSVQLELVRHSLLTRKIIKLDKQIEKLQQELSPRVKKMKTVGRVLRLLAYIPVCIYYYQSELILIDPTILWPVSVFVSTKTISLPVWLFIATGSLAFRHIYRTLLQILMRGTDFP